jgi:hypothetical protein
MYTSERIKVDTILNEFGINTTFWESGYSSQYSRNLQRVGTPSISGVGATIRRTFLEDIRGGARRGLLRSSSLSQESGVVQLALRGT